MTLRLVFVAVLVCALSAVSMAAEIPLANFDFEEFAEEVTAEEALGKLPYMWDLYADPNLDYWYAGLTNEKALSGEYSILIMDTSSEKGLMVRSYPVEAIPGKDYMALVNIFNVQEAPFKDTLQVYMEFWSEHGWNPESRTEWDRSKRVGVTWGGSKTFGEWEEFMLVGTAPEDAKYVTVGLYGHNAAIVKAYVDVVRLGVRD